MCPYYLIKILNLVFIVFLPMLQRFTYCERLWMKQPDSEDEDAFVNNCGFMTEAVQLVILLVYIPIEAYLLYALYSFRILVLNNMVDNWGEFVNRSDMERDQIIIAFGGQEVHYEPPHD